MPDAGARFDWFVVLAGMRTGSNLLESHLNAVPGVACHGEAFNPGFIGYPRRPDLLGVTLDQRLADPGPLLDRIRGAPGLNGFRLFHDHDPRAFDRALADPRCAKIVLTRNPLESYVSRRIAQETGQWILRGDARHRRDARIRFEPAGFDAHLADHLAFHRRILHALQTSGQTAFWLDYDDLADTDVIDGLRRFLGVGQAVPKTGAALLKQNPGALVENVSNPAEMVDALAQADWFGLTRLPDHEPRRGPAVRSMVACAAGLLFMPVSAGPDRSIRAWLQDLHPAGLLDGFNQRTLRDWKLAHPGHRGFTVLRHPVPRAWAAFRDAIVAGRCADLRAELIRLRQMPDPSGPAPDTATLRAAFHVFLRWVRSNLSGQTAHGVDAAWASQTAIVAGFSAFAVPDMILREDRLADDLAHLATVVGITAPPWTPAAATVQAPALRDVYDAETERLARAAYGRDYSGFGFSDWTPRADV